MSAPTAETTATYREVYAAMPPGYWPLVRRMGTWRWEQRPGHHEISELVLIAELMRMIP